MTNRRFVGKSALITGAASGIGKACAERLAAEGADVVLADVNEAGVSAVARAIAARGSKAFGFAYDAASPASCRTLVDEAQSRLGKLDVLCNIAGIMDWGHFAQFPEENWERVMRVNLSGVFYVTQRAIPHLLQTKGNVVNMASAAGLMGIAYTAAYCAAKAGVIAMTKSIAVEYASRGVRANAVCPGGVNTPLNDKVKPPEGIDFKLIERLSPKTGDMCEPEDIADMVAYLASAEARYVTGVAFAIDGGQTAG